MAAATEALLSEAPQRRWEEIAPESLPDCRAALCDALERICRSSDFRTSPRSCEFLRHVVQRTLDGDTASLKERLIGIELLGREASYDTSSDAGVRVRANDVRKRLVRYHAAAGANFEYALMLPCGTYVPQLLRASAAVLAAEQPITAPEGPAAGSARDRSATPPAAGPLTLCQLTLPLLIVSFLCIACMRWQMSQEESFDRFWNCVLGRGQAVLYLPPLATAGSQGAVSLQELEEAAPLLNLAGEFHHPLAVDSSASPKIPAGRNVLSLGVNVALRLAESVNPAAAGRGAPLLRFSVQRRPQGPVIVDSEAARAQQPLTHAALLTIDSGERMLVSVSGTDNAAVRALVSRLCSPRTFPSALAGSFQPGTVTQALFYGFPHGPTVIVRRRRYDAQASEEQSP